MGNSLRLQDHSDGRADLGCSGATLSLYIYASSLLETQLLHTMEMLGRSRSDRRAPCRSVATCRTSNSHCNSPFVLNSVTLFFGIYLLTCVGSSAMQRHNEMQMSGKSSATEKRKFSFLRCASDDRLGVNHV